jgi:O-antigen/teichoic acid export membrane protein
MSQRIIKNIGSGLIAQAWSAGLGLIVLPILVRGLGPERYGLLALSLAVIGFAAVADLGVGRAASKYLAEDFEKNETARTQVHVSSALTISTVMGVFGTGLLIALAPILVNHVLKVPPPLVREARIVLWVTALGLLPVLWRMSFDGVLAGHHRIATLSIGNMLVNTTKAGLSVLAILTGWSIIGVVVANVCATYLHAAGLWLYTRRYFSGRVNIRFGWHYQTARELLRLGLLSSAAYVLAGILLLYFDRFVIALFLPLAVLGYYSAAFDITSRQCYVSNPVGQAFFPVFSGKAGNPSEFESHYFHATKMQTVGLTGLTAMLIVLARPLLTYWISPEMGFHSASVMAILAVGMLLSSYSTLPYIAIIAGSTQPDVCPKIFAAAFVVHAILSLLLIKAAGILGVALALTAAFAFAFVASSHWVSKHLLVHSSLFFFFRQCFAATWMVALAVGIPWWFFIRPLVHNLWTTVAALVCGYLLYLAGCAMFAYSAGERTYVRKITRQFVGLPMDSQTAA